MMRYRIEKTCNGHTLYLRFGYWTLSQRQAQQFETRDAADHARAIKRQGGRIVPVGGQNVRIAA